MTRVYGRRGRRVGTREEGWERVELKGRQGEKGDWGEEEGGELEGDKGGKVSLP